MRFGAFHGMVCRRRFAHGAPLHYASNGATVFDYLQIYDPRERIFVGAADSLLKGYGALSRLLSARRGVGPPAQVLLLRLERIGDLLMTLGAIESVRHRLPHASIHLVVGTWNASLVPLIPGIDSFETLDLPWLVRGAPGASHAQLLARARRWRARRFDLALNFEPDIRSNLLLAMSGAARRVGFLSGGGAAFLTDALVYAPRAHTADNAQRLVEAAIPDSPAAASEAGARLAVPDEAKREAMTLLGHPDAGAFFIGVHASGGRTIKQWHMERLADVAARLARDFSGTVVLTGTRQDTPLVERLVSLLPIDIPRIDLAGSMSLPVFAGLLERLNLFVTADTGPMHLAAAVRTPTVALFGPSDPARYGPLSDRARVVAADLWCRPCNRVRRPPERCTGGVPECLNGIEVDMVYRAAAEVLSTSS
jgi:ADP-heptose:LPS heptosyltransferase